MFLILLTRFKTITMITIVPTTFVSVKNSKNYWCYLSNSKFSNPNILHFIQELFICISTLLSTFSSMFISVHPTSLCCMLFPPYSLTYSMLCSHPTLYRHPTLSRIACGVLTLRSADTLLSHV